MNKQLIEKLRSLKFTQVIYPVTSLLFFLIMLVLFIWAARFLSLQINKPFSITDKTLEEGLLKVDVATYMRV